MTENSAATGAGELKRYYLIGFPYYRAEDADAVLAASRAREAKKDAALSGFLAIVNRTDFLAAIAGEVPNASIHALGAAITDALAALSPNAKEADHD